MRRTTLLLATAAVAATLVSAAPRPQAPPPSALGLPGLLADWAYPAADVLGSGGGSGGNALVVVQTARAILTTPDPVADVLAFYRKELGLPGRGEAAGAVQDARAVARDGGTSAVTVQDDSAGRPVDLMILNGQRGRTHVTIVISRAKGEPRTHIALACTSTDAARP